MANQLGKLIGKITRVFNTTLHDGSKVQTSVTFDCTTSTDDEIKSWISSDRAIATQRPMRVLSSAEALASYHNATLLANEVGKKIKSRAERIAELVNAGMPEKLATMMIDDPAKFNDVMSSVETE